MNRTARRLLCPRPTHLPMHLSRCQTCRRAQVPTEGSSTGPRQCEGRAHEHPAVTKPGRRDERDGIERAQYRDQLFSDAGRREERKEAVNKQRGSPPLRRGRGRPPPCTDHGGLRREVRAQHTRVSSMCLRTRVNTSTSVQVYGSVSVRMCPRARRRRDNDEMTGEPPRLRPRRCDD